MYRTGEIAGVGRPAPEFSLKDTDLKDVKLSGYRGKVNVLLVFYGGAADPQSLKWLSRLNDDYLYFRGLETEILAISPDRIEKSGYASARYKLDFKLLSDPLKKVIGEYGVLNDLGEASPAIFIVDRSGVIRYRWAGTLPGELPPNEKLLETIRSMA